MGDNPAYSNWTTCEVDHRRRGPGEQEKGGRGRAGRRRGGREEVEGIEEERRRMRKKGMGRKQTAVATEKDRIRYDTRKCP